MLLLPTPSITSRIPWRGLLAPRAAASALRQPRSSPAEPPPGPQSRTCAPRVFKLDFLAPPSQGQGPSHRLGSPRVALELAQSLNGRG